MRATITTAAFTGAVLLAGCGGSAVKPEPTPKPTVSRVALEIRAARASDQKLFAIFPSLPGRRQCAIPSIAGVTEGMLHGTCTTRVVYPDTHGHPEARVVFRENWAKRYSSWTVMEELPARKVLATVLGGAPAPQMHYGTGSVAGSHLVGGDVQVVALPSGGIFICPDYAIAADSWGGPPRPPRSGGLPAVGVRVGELHSHSKKPRARWGNLHVVGVLRDGTFWVTSQRLPRRGGSQPFLETPPCPAPPGGWRLVAPTDAQRATIDHYFTLAHHHDLTAVAYFHDGTIPTVTSTHLARTREVLGPYWPDQLCVVRARYSRALIDRVGRRMVKLLESRTDAGRYGWISGAGGHSENDDGQPTTPIEVLIVTQQLRAVLRRQPPGLVEVDAVLKPVPQA